MVCLTLLYQGCAIPPLRSYIKMLSHCTVFAHSYTFFRLVIIFCIWLKGINSVATKEMLSWNSSICCHTRGWRSYHFSSSIKITRKQWGIELLYFISLHRFLHLTLIMPAFRVNLLMIPVKSLNLGFDNPLVICIMYLANSFSGLKKWRRTQSETEVAYWTLITIVTLESKLAELAVIQHHFSDGHRSCFASSRSSQSFVGTKIRRGKKHKSQYDLDTG